MKRAYSKSSYAKPCEQYCREQYPDEAERIFASAEEYCLGFMKDMPDLGENMMAKNMLDWFTILAFYEASGHRMDGETLGRDCCDYWYVGDKSPVLKEYEGLREI